jgi:hypothetical protein
MKIWKIKPPKNSKYAFKKKNMASLDWAQTYLLGLKNLTKVKIKKGGLDWIFSLLILNFTSSLMKLQNT